MKLKWVPDGHRLSCPKCGSRIMSIGHLERGSVQRPTAQGKVQGDVLSTLWVCKCQVWIRMYDQDWRHIGPIDGTEAWPGEEP